MFDDYNTPDKAKVANGSSQDKPFEASIPTVKTPPVYSTNHYSRKQAPPPPPLRESAARERVKRRRVNGRGSSADWAWVIVAGALFGIVLIVSMGAVLLVRAAQQEVAVIPTAAVAELLPTPVLAYNDFNAASAELGEVLILPDGSSIELRPWDGRSRFTMIMVGLDRREGETGLAYRTDTMMLISLDPINSTIGVLSIPRDLFVQVPGYSELQRINTPMFFGETQRPGYGPTLMMQTVQLNLGIIVNDFVAVDFQAFIDIIDALGGITVDNARTINDPLYPNLNYGYDPFYLAAGIHNLNGYNALRFARTRHGDSDIARAERQQQVLYAIRDKVLRLDMLPVLLTQAPALWASLEQNLYTGLSLEQIIQLGLYARDIPLENITMGVIDFQYLRSYTTNSGASVLIPNRAKLGELMTQTFGPNYAQS